MVERSADDLRGAVARFRAARAELYLASLAGGGVPDPRRSRDLAAPCHPERVGAYSELAGELSPREHAALGAHMVRAQVEAAVAGARVRTRGRAALPAEVGGEQAPLSRHWSEPGRFADPAGREALSRGTERALDGAFEAQTAACHAADAAAAEAFRQLQPGRHPDAGPEGGVADAARAYLGDSADLFREATAQVARARGVELRHGADLFAALRCADLVGLGPGGRGRRLGDLWRGLGLGEALDRAVRLGAPHAAGWPAAQVVLRTAGQTAVIAPSPVEAGLCSELALFEASGRALGQVLVSRALPVELRHPAVGSVARGLGQLAVWGLAQPPLWKRHYGADRSDAHLLAQATAAFALCRARVHAASVLARGLGLHDLADLARETLGVEVPPETAAALLLRLSPGGDARAALWAAGLAAALRERFDEDWLRNARAAEPLVGACMRGGDTCIEVLAEDLGASREAGLSMLAELF